MRAKKRSSRPLVRSGRSTCGTCPQPSSRICSEEGSQRSTWRWKPGRISLSCEDQTNIAGGSRRQARVEAALAERLLEVDVARGGEERQPRAALR